MRDWASSGRVKIDMANEHIRHLEAEMAAYVSRRPYIVTPEIDEDDKILGVVLMGHTFIVSQREKIDSRWPAIVADAIHNLHVALDHLWQRVTTRNGRRKNYFPAYESPEAAKTFLKRKEKGRRHPAVDILLSVNAFEVGNPFWRIRQFDDTDKHDSLTLVACYPGTLTVTGAGEGGQEPPTEWRYVPPGERRRRVPFPPLEDGAIIYASPYVPDLDVDVNLAPLIAFGEGELLEGEPVLETLQNLATSVESLVAVFVEKGLLK